MKNSWEQLTIKEYIDILNIQNSKDNEFEKIVKIISVLSGKTEDELNTLSYSELKEYYPSLEFLKINMDKQNIQDYYTIGGIRYKFIKEVKNLTAGQMIDLIHYTKNEEEQLANIDLICSTLLIPEGEKYLQTPLEETTKNLYNNMLVIDARGIAVFFYLLFESFLIITKTYLEEEIPEQLKLVLSNLEKENPKLMKEMMEEIGTLKRGAGKLQLTG